MQAPLEQSIVNATQLRSARPPLRSCCRCGREFRCENGKICDACRRPKSANKPLNPNLSFREKQVISLITEAKLNKEIAYELHLSEGTIKEYLNRIFRKLGMTNRTELAIWAVNHRSMEPTDIKHAATSPIRFAEERGTARSRRVVNSGPGKA
jgi:DNA-binding CsgD family transcriptional regulator